jgi:type VI secretion system protein ImpK
MLQITPASGIRHPVFEGQSMQMAPTLEKRTIAHPTAQSGGDLVRQATAVLEKVMQIRSGLLIPSPELRDHVKEYLQQMQRNSAGRDQQAQAAMFALVAFVDETVLLADFPLRSEWMSYPLQLEMFQTNVAGIEFYDRLSNLLLNTQANADVIEIYYLCLLLGFKGRYYIETDRKGVIDVVAGHLRKVGRLRDNALADNWEKNDQPQPRAVKSLPSWVAVGGGVWLWVLVLLLIVASFLLSVELNAAKGTLLR